MQNGENDSRSSKEKKSLKRIRSLIISGSDPPEVFQSTKNSALLHSGACKFAGHISRDEADSGRRDGVLGALLSKVKSNFLCSIRPISQNVAALDFSKLLQKRDG